MVIPPFVNKVKHILTSDAWFDSRRAFQVEHAFKPLFISDEALKNPSGDVHHAAAHEVEAFREIRVRLHE